MKITSETRERRCNNYRMQNKTLNFKIAHAGYACLCFLLCAISMVSLLTAYSFPNHRWWSIAIEWVAFWVWDRFLDLPCFFWCQRSTISSTSVSTPRHQTWRLSTGRFPYSCWFVQFWKGLHCTVLHCTVPLYWNGLDCTVLCWTGLYCTVLYCTVPHCTVLCCAVLCWAVLCRAVHFIIPLLRHFTI